MEGRKDKEMCTINHAVNKTQVALLRIVGYIRTGNWHGNDHQMGTNHLSVIFFSTSEVNADFLCRFKLTIIL